MESYTNEKGEKVIIREMDAHRLVHAIAKYAKRFGIAEAMSEPYTEVEQLVKALKDEAIKRLTQ